MVSVWSANSEKLSFPKYTGNQKTDFLIIGGGMAGVLCAYYCNRYKIRYLLVEANEIGEGTTKNSSAKITSQHGFVYDKIIQQFGVERAAQYYHANEHALYQYRDLCRSIECDFETKDNYVYSLHNRKNIEQELKALEQIHCDARYVKELPLPIQTQGAICFLDQAQFNPMKFLYGIAKGLNIYEHTRVLSVDGHVAVTEHGSITADRIVIATHFPILNKSGFYFMKMYQHRSYMLGLENAPSYDGMYVDEALVGMTFRNYKDLLLIGGGDHRTGKQGGSYKYLREFASLYYPEANEKYSWATQDCMSVDSVPYIGRYGKKQDHLLVATGFNKWGMTGAMTAAMIIGDMARGKTNEYEETFSPQRTMLRKQVFVNGLEAVKGLCTFKKRRCPHLGCALKYNRHEHTWDCSCHGSRFAEDGTLIDVPANHDANV